jgi:uncharacterized protein (UPF0264 family)
MTQLLISVTSIEEAQIALENGADIIDLKDPSAGALGALPLQKIQAIAIYVNGKRPMSATIGDLPMQPILLLQHVLQLASTKIDFIKIGFFEAKDYQPSLDALKQATQAGVKLIAILFAEYQYPNSLIAAIQKAGFSGVMLDTMQKNGATFLDYYSEDDIHHFAENVFKHGLLFGLAGSLRLQHVTSVKKINPTYVGFRGGVCIENHRASSLDVEKIRRIREVL